MSELHDALMEIQKLREEHHNRSIYYLRSLQELEDRINKEIEKE